MKTLLTILCHCWLWLSLASAQDPNLEKLRGIEIEQKVGATVPLNLLFRDETGAPARLGNYFGEKPVVLVLAYYDCPNLCTLVLNALLESARNLRLEAGRDFQVVVVSIRPEESPALAAAKKKTYITRYGRLNAAQGWHFLTGAAAPIQELAQAVGFRYVYDPASNQFAHASGILVATPLGKISRYFLGIEYPPEGLRLALVEASQGRLGSLADRLVLLCFHYNPQSGRYTLAITRVLQAGGVGTVLLLGLALYRAHRPPRVSASSAPIA